MGIQMTNDISPLMSKQSRTLSKQAMRELKKSGTTEVICPKCGTIPKMTKTLNSERITVSCKCGYIFDAEINF